MEESRGVIFKSKDKLLTSLCIRNSEIYNALHTNCIHEIMWFEGVNV